MTMMKALELLLNKEMNNTNDSAFTVAMTSVPKPSPSSNELLIKVQYSAIDTAFDSIPTWKGSFLKDLKSKPIIPGYHFSGYIEQVGKDVTDEGLAVGAAVFGHLPYSSATKQGAFSEFLTVQADACAIKPPSVSMQVAAASATEALTALQAVRDIGGLTAGQTVLIIGGGGGVGGAAVGVAKSLGANVTAVCSTRDVERVSALGADRVIDRTMEDVTKMASLKSSFDVVFDATSKYSIWDGTKWLKPEGGALVTTQPTLQLVFMGWFCRFVTGKKIAQVMCAPKKEDFELVGKWMTNGTLKIEVDSEYKVSDFDQAWTRHKGSKHGRVVIQVDGGW